MLHNIIIKSTDLWGGLCVTYSFTVIITNTLVKILNNYCVKTDEAQHQCESSNQQLIN